MRHGVQRPGAAEGEQHEIAQVVAAHGGDRLDRLLHLDVDDAHDAFGGVVDRHHASGLAMCVSIARGALAASSRIRPPRKLSGLSRPSTRLQSVMVGLLPPRP